MKILIGVDGSDGSMEAVRQIGLLASPERDELTLFYRPPDVHLAEPSTVAAEVTPRVQRVFGEGVFERAKESLPKAFHDKLRKVVSEDSPARGLLSEAERWGAELIAVGARGIGPIKRLMLGSVSRSVARHAEVPVLIARPADEGPPAGSPWRVLLATDGSTESRAAGEVLGKFHWPDDAEGYVMTVVESLLLADVPDWLEQYARTADSEAMAQAWQNEHEHEKDAARAELTAYRAQLPKLFAKSDPIVSEGHVAEQVLKTIAAEGINLVAVGAQGKNVWERLVVGSTSETLLSNAGCSVLIVRSK